jgi:hypothetical protein
MSRCSHWATLGVVVASLLSPLSTRADAIGFGTGPVSALYLTADNQQHILEIQGNTVKTFAAQKPGENVIAVSTDLGVQTVNGNNPGYLGSQYSLGLVPTGTTYALPAVGGTSADGTTDGIHNYFLNYVAGPFLVEVTRTDRSWRNPTVLFSIPGDPEGITYDASNQSLWVSEELGSQVSDYTLGGKLLSTFSTGHSFNTALALDPADGTLWLDNSFGPGVRLEQYSKSGLLLSKFSYNTLDAFDGGEFAFAAPVPLPGAMRAAMMLFGGIGAAKLLGRSRRAARVA